MDQLSLSKRMTVGCGVDSRERGLGHVSRFVGRGYSLMEFQRDALREFYITFLPSPEPLNTTESVEEIYTRVGEFLAQTGAEVVSERCYAVPEEYDRIRGVRAAAYQKCQAEPDGSLCLVGAIPCTTSTLAGIQLWAVQSSPKPVVHTIRSDGRAVGRRFSHRNVDYISLASLIPPVSRDPAWTIQEHAVSMFREAQRILSSQGCSYHDVVRTWIYLPRLLTWYDQFNAARRQAYHEVGLINQRQIIWLPASTGIQGQCPTGDECMMDLLCVHRGRGSPLEMQMLHSPWQCEAFAYGSMFSRAVEVRDESVSRIYVSGTASIGEDGKTVHLGNAREQIRRTLRTVRELLAPRRHSLGDLTHGVAFLKRAGDCPDFEALAAEEGLDPRRVIATVADVCRDDLLFELEVMTVRPLDHQDGA